MRSFFFILIFFLSFPLFSYSSDLPPEIHRSLYEAQESLKKDNPAKARQILSECIRKHPDKIGAQVYEMLGTACYQSGNHADAYDAWQKGLGLAPGSFSLCVNLGKSAYELKKFREAGSLFEKAAGLDASRSSELLYQSAVSFYQGKSLRECAAVLEKLLKRKNPDSQWLRLYISVCMESGDMKKAGNLLSRFLERNPGDREFWKLLARVRMQTGNYKEAAAALEIACGLEKPGKKEQEELAELYLYINIPLRALQILEQIYGSSLSAKQCEKLVRIAVQAQRPEKALSLLDKAIAQQPKPEYYLEKGKILYGQGRYDKAMQELDTCIRQAPDISGLSEARLLMGYCAMERGDYETAEKELSLSLRDEKYRENAAAALAFIREIRENTDSR